jgi:hypothetical protein
MSIIAITLATRHLLRRRRAAAAEEVPSFTPGDFLKGALQACHRTLLQAVEPLSEEEMAWRPYPETQSAGFLVWHVARVQDALVHQQLLNKPEVWVTQGWAQQLGLSPVETGQDFTPDQIAQFQEPPKGELLGYLAATVQAAVRAIDGLGPEGLDVATEKGMQRVRYLVILVNHANMHAGAISYIRDVLTASREVPSELEL